MNPVDVMVSEREALRTELVQLKQCQVRYFALTLAGTGALFGWGATGGLGDAAPKILFLIPLVLVLPSWWIFFDKATTITRIIGYYRLLETMIVDPGVAGQEYIGWENSLASFRKHQRVMRRCFRLGHRIRRYLRELRAGLRQLVTLSTAHRYWVINWYSFFLLSAFSWALGTGVWNGKIDWSAVGSPRALVTAAAIIATILHLTYLVGSMTCGRRSYDGNECFWRAVFKVRDA